MRSKATFAAAALALLMLCAAAARAQVTVIRAGKLVAPETGATSVNAVVSSRWPVVSFSKAVSRPRSVVRCLSFTVLTAFDATRQPAEHGRLTTDHGRLTVFH